MAEELRLALILLGALAIGSVILHGIWTVRRTVNEERKAQKLEQQEQALEQVEPEDEEAQRLKLNQMEMDFATLAQAEPKDGGIPVANLDVDSIYQQETDLQQDERAELSQQAGLSDELDTPELTESLGQDEQGLSGTTNLAQVDLDDSAMPSISTLEIEDDSAAISLNLSQVDVEPTAAIEQNAEPEKQEVLMLFIDKPEGEAIDGAKLLPTLLTLGFKFGEMGLFHRHQDSSGNGEVLFSLANMYNPGTFDIDNMEQLSTRGLTIFMTLPNAAEPLQTFNMMHNAAKKIADEFAAKVLDDERNPLDVAIVRNYVEKIRKF